MNSVNCNTSWKINLFMQFCDHMEEVLKGVRKEVWLPGPDRGDRTREQPLGSVTRAEKRSCLEGRNSWENSPHGEQRSEVERDILGSAGGREPRAQITRITLCLGVLN